MKKNQGKIKLTKDKVIIKGKCKCGEKIIVEYERGEVYNKRCLKCGEGLYFPYYNKLFKVV